MVRTTPFDPVKRFDISRTLLGKGRYWTTACWAVSPGPHGVDGLLIDSGCAHAML